MASSSTATVLEMVSLPSETLASPHKVTTSETTRQVLPEVRPPPKPRTLGRRVFEAKPSVHLSQTSKTIIASLIITLNMVQFVSNFVTVNGGLEFSRILGREAGPGSTWLAASYSLPQSTMVLVSGRVGAVYGHQFMALVGSAIFTVFSLLQCSCDNYVAFVVVRALTGIGAGIFMPNGVTIITMMVPPGKYRNIALGFFGASPPIGGGLGAVLSGACLGVVDWRYMFILIGGLSLVFSLALAWTLPRETPVDKGGKIDWIGCVLGLSSLIIFNVVWNQAPSVGWNTPYEIAFLILSVLLFCSFLVWEHRYAGEEAVMPLHLFKAPTFTALIFVVLITYMSFGIFIWYSTTWQQIFRHASIMETALHFLPFVVTALFAVGFAAWLIPRVAAQYIMAMGIAASLIPNLLLASMPVHQTFWAQVFVATAVAGFCSDFVYVAAQVIASNSVGKREQGVASSLVGTLNLYGNSLGLGFAGTIETELSKGSGGESVIGYRAALYFGAALALVGLLLDFGFVRMPKDVREGWDEPIHEGEGRHLGGVLEPSASASAVEVQTHV